MSIRPKVIQKSSRTRLAFIGLGSLMDLTGMKTYKAMQAEMLKPVRRPLNSSFRVVAESMTPLSSRESLR